MRRKGEEFLRPGQAADMDKEQWDRYIQLANTHTVLLPVRLQNLIDEDVRQLGVTGCSVIADWILQGEPDDPFDYGGSISNYE